MLDWFNNNNNNYNRALITIIRIGLLLLVVGLGNKNNIARAQYGGYHWSRCNTDFEFYQLNTLPAGGNYAFFSFNSDEYHWEGNYAVVSAKYGSPVCTQDPYVNGVIVSFRQTYAGWSVWDPCPNGFYAVNFLYYLDPPIQCMPCTPRSSSSLLPSNAHYTTNGNFMDACAQWLCNAGFYRKSVNHLDPRQDICEPCTNNHYSLGTSDNTCIQCPPVKDSDKARCSAGEYYILSNVDCSFVKCGYCLTKPANTYFTLSGSGY